MAIFSPGQHHGFSILVVFHSLICWKVIPVEKSMGNFFTADLYLGASFQSDEQDQVIEITKIVLSNKLLS